MSDQNKHTIEFFFDPSCPFCWITSRWLTVVEQHRTITISWRPFSLALKNHELQPNNSDATPYGEAHRNSHQVLRVIWRASKHYNTDIGKLYTDFGKKHFIDNQPYYQTTVEAVLVSNGLPEDLVSAMNDATIDDNLSAELNAATAVAGEDIGVPTIVFINNNGGKTGYFGPVLQALPSSKEGLKLWDGLAQLASDQHFYELKRSRPADGPDTTSTTTLFRAT